MVFADAGYRGIKSAPMQRLSALLDAAEELKAAVRAKVEYPFWMLKRQFGSVKVLRYQGLKKPPCS